MLRAISLLFTAVFVALLVTFAIANKDFATVSFWPFPGNIDLPIFLLIYGGFVIGFVVGGIFTVFKKPSSRRDKPVKADIKSKKDEPTIVHEQQPTD